MPSAHTPCWPDARQMTHTGHLRRRNWRPDDNQNRAYPSRQTVQTDGSTSKETCWRLVSEASGATSLTWVLEQESCWRLVSEASGARSLTWVFQQASCWRLESE